MILELYYSYSTSTTDYLRTSFGTLASQRTRGRVSPAVPLPSPFRGRRVEPPLISRACRVRRAVPSVFLRPFRSSAESSLRKEGRKRKRRAHRKDRRRAFRLLHALHRGRRRLGSTPSRADNTRATIPALPRRLSRGTHARHQTTDAAVHVRDANRRRRGGRRLPGTDRAVRRDTSRFG